MATDRQYHLGIPKTGLPPYVLTCGSPERVRQIGEVLEGTEELAFQRGLLSLRGSFEGLEIFCFTSGMGPASMALTLPEALSSVSLKGNQRATVLRLGTCGSLQKKVSVGDFIVSRGSVRDEGTTTKWAPISYPALADPLLEMACLSAALEKGKEFEKNLFSGITHAKDELYATEAPSAYPMRHERTDFLRSLHELGVLATEMEFSVMSVFAAIEKLHPGRGPSVGSLLHVASPYHDVTKAGDEVTFAKLDSKEGIEISLNALKTAHDWREGRSLEKAQEVIKICL